MSFPGNVTDICGQVEEITLESSGRRSAVTIELGGGVGLLGACKLKVSAPITHVISMQWDMPVQDERRNFLENREFSGAWCNLSVVSLPETQDQKISTALITRLATAGKRDDSCLERKSLWRATSARRSSLHSPADGGVEAFFKP